eukprot:SAG22_NODE_393_length_11204_cov_5.356686_8_plen_286_part_00
MVTTRACTRTASAASKAAASLKPVVRASAGAGGVRRTTELHKPLAVARGALQSKKKPASALSKRARSSSSSPSAAAAAAAAVAAVAKSDSLRGLETTMREKGCQVVVGVDEAGRGPLAGPVVAVACHVPHDVHVPGVDDSKKLDEKQREELYAKIVAHPRIRWAVAEVTAERIDEINILQATMECMRAAVHGLSEMPDCVLIDGNRLPWGNKAGKRANGSIRPADPPRPAQIKELHAVVKGDAKVYSIAAASIIVSSSVSRRGPSRSSSTPVCLRLLPGKIMCLV